MEFPKMGKRMMMDSENRRLRRILKTQWPDTISNLELWKETSQITVTEEILQRNWQW
jgi:hypothetical protein